MPLIHNLETFESKPKSGLILNFGPPMSGKTRSLYTLVRYLKKAGAKPPVLDIHDLDGNADTLIRMVKTIPGILPDDIRVFTYTPAGGDRVGETQHKPKQQGWEIFMDWLKTFNKYYDIIDPKTGLWLPDSVHPSAIALDSFTKLEDHILDFVLRCMGQELNAPGTDGRAQWGGQMRKITEVVDSCKGIPALVIFNMHEKLDKNEVTGEIRIDPLVTGQLAPVFGKEFKIVVYSKSRPSPEGTKYVWLTKPDGFVKAAGTRLSDTLAKEIEQDYALLLG